MVKIRKKTSARQSTHDREKIKKKIAEHKRKTKKAAKKDITWKSKSKKDPGIPNLFPYKDQIVAEVQQKREEQEKLKQARKEILSLAKLQVDEPVEAPEDDEGSGSEMEEAESNLKTHARSLRSVISTADILVQVLDARDPLGTRTVQLEKEILQAVPAKKLVFVLNKIDLVPKENVTKWLEYLRRSFPTLPFKSSTQLQRAHLAGDAASAALLQLLKGYSKGSAKSLSVGVIGLPNVGKSSLINTLKRRKSCAVAPIPGWTKDIQTITLEGGLKVLDCPGVVLSSGSETSVAQQVLKGTIPIEQVEDVVTPIELLLSKCKKEHLMLLYNIPNFDTVQQFLLHVARAKGRLKKGGLPDISGIARTIIRDWTAGRIPYFTIPPALPQASAVASTSKSVMADSTAGGDQILSGFSAEFDLDALFKSADEAAFKEASTARGVAMSGNFAESQEGEVKLIGEDDETMSATEPTSAKKRKVEDDHGTVAIGNVKKVAFAGDAKQTKMFTSAEQEQLSQTAGQNKAIARAAKKAKKKQAKQSGSSMDTSEDAPAASAEVEDPGYLGFEARASALSLGGQDDKDDDAYDFQAFFGVKSKLKLDQTA